MKTKPVFPAGRVLAAASLAIVTFAFGTAHADIPSYATKSADQGFRALSRSSHCDDRNRDAPEMSGSSSSGVASLAQNCLSDASGGRIDRAANSAYNAAQLYFALGTAQPTDSTAAVQYFGQAISAADRSTNLLTAQDSSIRSNNAENTRFKFERDRIIAASHALLGLSDAAGATRACGTRLECLTKAIEFIDDGQRGGNALQIGFQAGEYRIDGEKLRVLRAAAAAKQVELQGGGSLSTVISDLGTAAAALSALSGTPGASQVARDARNMLVELVTSEADGLLDGADSQIDVQNAINTLENGVASVRRAGGTDVVAAQLYAEQGDAYLKLAELDESGPTVTAYCSAANAYLNADQLGGVAASALRGLVGQGTSLAMAHEAGAETCPANVMRGESTTALAAIDAFEEARRTSQPADSLEAASYVQLAKLYLEQDDTDQSVIDDLLARATSGPVSGPELASVYVDIASAKMPAISASADRVSAFCAEDAGSVRTSLNTARNADPDAPQMLFELGRLEYLCGSKTIADNLLVTALDEAKPDSEWRELRAKAQHFRSLRVLDQAMGKSTNSRIGDARRAADLSEVALSFDPSEPAFRLQACRARLAGPQRLARLGAERSQCAIASETNDGALLDVLMALRTAKTQFTQSNGRNYPAFGDARDSILQARGRLENNISTNDAPAEFRWPGMSRSAEYLDIVDYGSAIARACSISTGNFEFVDIPDDPDGVSEAFFRSYNVFLCIYPDKDE
ncbi:MAG: hypothetical protein AAGJ84_13570 [Pseudomonadota bacterium]